MLSSHAVPGPESALSPAGETVSQAPVVDLAYHAHRTGVVLIGTGVLGGLIGLFTLSPLGILLAIVSCAAGAYLIRACQHVVSGTELRQGRSEHGPEALGQGAVLLKQMGVLAMDGMAVLTQAGAQLAEAVAGLVRGAVKVLGCFLAGVGIGLITVGLFALRQPELWEYDRLTRAGPPVAPVALGAGIGLLVMELLVVAMFYRSWKRRAKPTGVAGALGQAQN